MIVAPLIFGGIVTGIAGHNQLSGVGRVAVKALIFFEVVTTFGLLLGAIAIDITQAGAGVTLPQSFRLSRPPRVQKAGSRFSSTSSPKTSPKPSLKIKSSRSPSSLCSSAPRWPCCPSPNAPRC
jgi:Na+/H+-dicarboxylate symporter